MSRETINHPSIARSEVLFICTNTGIVSSHYLTVYLDYDIDEASDKAHLLAARTIRAIMISAEGNRGWLHAFRVICKIERWKRQPPFVDTDSPRNVYLNCAPLFHFFFFFPPSMRCLSSRVCEKSHSRESPVVNGEEGCFSKLPINRDEITGIGIISVFDRTTHPRQFSAMLSAVRGRREREPPGYITDYQRYEHVYSYRV